VGSGRSAQWQWALGSGHWALALGSGLLVWALLGSGSGFWFWVVVTEEVRCGCEVGAAKVEKGAWKKGGLGLSLEQLWALESGATSQPGRSK
jgi:hypothetical protein